MSARAASFAAALALVAAAGTARAQTEPPVETGAEAQPPVETGAEILLPATRIEAAPPPPARRPRNTVIWQPFSLIWAVIDLEYERVLERHVGVFADASIVPGIEHDLDGSSHPYIFGVATDLGVRAYPLGTAPGGLFASAYTGYSSFEDLYGTRYSGSGFRFGAMVGYTFLIVGVVDISLGAGFEWLYFVRGIDGYVDRHAYPTLRVAVGPAF